MRFVSLTRAPRDGREIAHAGVGTGFVVAADQGGDDGLRLIVVCEAVLPDPLELKHTHERFRERRSARCVGQDELLRKATAARARAVVLLASDENGVNYDCRPIAVIRD